MHTIILSNKLIIWIMLLILLCIFSRIRSCFKLKRRRHLFKTKYNNLVKKFNAMRVLVIALQFNVNRHNKQIETLSNKITAFEILEKVNDTKKQKEPKNGS